MLKKTVVSTSSFCSEYYDVKNKIVLFSLPRSNGPRKIMEVARSRLSTTVRAKAEATTRLWPAVARLRTHNDCLHLAGTVEHALLHSGASCTVDPRLCDPPGRRRYCTHSRGARLSACSTVVERQCFLSCVTGKLCRSQSRLKYVLQSSLHLVNSSMEQQKERKW